MFLIFNSSVVSITYGPCVNNRYFNIKCEYKHNNLITIHIHTVKYTTLIKQLILATSHKPSIRPDISDHFKTGITLFILLIGVYI